MTAHIDIKNFLALEPRYYRYLKSISFYRDISSYGCSRYEMELILWRVDNCPLKELVFQAVGVSNISIGKADGLLGVLLDIEDLRSQHLEGVNFRILDQENDLLSFFCESFSVQVR